MPAMPPIPPRHPFVRAVAHGLRHHCGVEAGDGLLLAVSGGADSLALLRAVHALSPRRAWRLSLTVGHVHHHLRPAAQAEADADLVRGLSQRLGLPFQRCDLEPTARPGNAEAGARALRYEALAEMARTCGAAAVVTGHHGDDQLETVLMRLLRGASVTGMAGMAWRRRLSPGVRLIRPMLGVTHDRAESFLRDIDQPWREDATNRDTTRWRARLRGQVLPVLKELRPDAADKAVALGDHLRDVRRLLDAEAARCDAWVVRDADRWTLPRHGARDLNPAVLTALCRSLLIEAGAPPDALPRRVLAPLGRVIRDGAGGERRFSIAAGVTVTVTKQAVTIRGAPRV